MLLLATLPRLNIAFPLLGLKCWHCLNSRGLVDCLRKGRLQQCEENEVRIYIYIHILTKNSIQTVLYFQNN